jgi:DNA-binding CsgD family transcriptional regulator
MPLSPTENAVLALADQGKSYKEISSQLNISVNTVKFHVKNILAKTIGSACLAQAAYLRGGSRIRAAA